MMNLKKDNDNYRDNVKHAKQQRNGILRACYLPQISVSFVVVDMTGNLDSYGGERLTKW